MKCVFKPFVRVLSLLLSISVLFGTVGCGQDAETDDLTAAAVIKAEEQLITDGITPEDVLAVYNELARDAFRAAYATEEQKSKLIYDLDNFSAKFISFTPPTTNLGKVFYFYYLSSTYYVRGPWRHIEGGTFYREETPEIPNTYEIRLNTRVSCPIRSEDENLAMGISKDAMEEIFKAFDIASFTMTKEWMSAQEDVNLASMGMIVLGETVYEGFSVDKNTIKNATEEQLWALYHAIESLYSINFHYELPQEGKDYAIEIS